MPLVQITEPALEPVSLEEAKNHLRVDADLTSDDALIVMLIGAARRYAEMYCNRSFITRKWRLVLDSFPGAVAMGVPFGITYSLPGNVIQLERGPVQSVDSIIYTAMDRSFNAMSPSDWVTDTSGGLARVMPRFGAIWPIPLPEIGAIQVNYTAGYGANASDVPAGIRHWILLRVNTLYENREEVAILPRGKADPLPFIDSLLDPYRVVLA